MNTAKHLIERIRPEVETGTGLKKPTATAVLPEVESSVPVVELLPLLLDSPSHELNVSEAGSSIGVLNESLLLEGLASEFEQGGANSLITVECVLADYSASRIAMAVEDTGVHLLDLWSNRGEGGKRVVTLRVNCEDPTSVIHSLERYGYEVTDVYARQYADAELATERLMALQSYLRV